MVSTSMGRADGAWVDSDAGVVGGDESHVCGADAAATSVAIGAGKEEEAGDKCEIARREHVSEGPGASGRNKSVGSTPSEAATRSANSGSWDEKSIRESSGSSLGIMKVWYAATSAFARTRPNDSSLLAGSRVGATDRSAGGRFPLLPGCSKAFQRRAHAFTK